MVDQYGDTSHSPEALERLTECFVALGLVGEARKTAAVLGYNYPGSEWYKDAYTKVEGVPPPKPDQVLAQQMPPADAAQAPAQQDLAAPPPGATADAALAPLEKPKLPWWKLW